MRRGTWRERGRVLRRLRVPRYKNGNAPLGVWSYEAAYAFDDWLDYEDFTYDQGMLLMQRDDSGDSLQHYTGGNGLKWNYPAAAKNVTIWGWPANGAYDGQNARRCAGKTKSTYSFGYPDAVMPCNMKAGSAGGPWFRPQKRPNLGYVYAVTSRSTASGKHRLIATPFDDSIDLLYQYVNDTAVGSER